MFFKVIIFFIHIFLISLIQGIKKLIVLNMKIKNQFLKLQLHCICLKVLSLMGVTYSYVSCLLSYDWAPQSPAIGRGYYISRTDGGLRRWLEEWKSGWTARVLHKHRKYHYAVGSALSSLQLFLPQSPFLLLYLFIGEPSNVKDFYSYCRAL